MGYKAILLLSLGAATLNGASITPGDANRGKSLFRSSSCVECHRVAGEGEGTAADLGKRIGRDHTPAGLAATLWNHAPTMWAAMEAKGISKPEMSAADASDLFAFFHASGYFEKPGDAARGKRAFERKGCAGCHSLEPDTEKVGPAVAQWNSLSSTVDLAAEMWNHGAAMEKAMQERGMRKWPQLSQQELTDLLIYLRHGPGQEGKPAEFRLSGVERGHKLLNEKGCARCHTESGYGESHTVTSFSAAMWNHSVQMRKNMSSDDLVQLSGRDMEAILAALWSEHLYAESGNPKSGEKVFSRKGCAGCHEADSSLAQEEKPLREFGMVSALWRHGPGMKAEMESKGIEWPRFSVADMADLLTFLNTLDENSR